MALTFTATDTQYVGTRLVRDGYFTFDSSYPTDGEAITAAAMGFVTLASVQAFPCKGYSFDWDSSNLKLKAFADIAHLTETVAKSAMTDGGSTSGTKAFANTIPAGSLVLGWTAVVNTAFAGDTSAVMKVGISGDDDRFSADTTQSVFATGTVGCLPSADVRATAGTALTPLVTVTSASDFTNTTAGATMAVTIDYCGRTGPVEVAPGTDLSGLTTVRARIIGN